MYIFNLKASRHRPVPRDVEEIIDLMMIKPFVKIPDPSLSIKLGTYASELKNKGILKLYRNGNDKETIACLTINNFVRPNSVSKETGKLTKYIFIDTLIPKNYLDLI